MWLLQTDEIKNDITSNLVLPIEYKTKEITAEITSRETCVIAGLEEVLFTLDKFAPQLVAKTYAYDGQQVEKGEKILEITGDVFSILVYERTILNILQRMSGIATETKRYASQLGDSTYIAATRKTPWTLLDKKAVAVGGGVTHRLTLADGVLVKDNHLLLLKKAFNIEKEDEIIQKMLQNILPKAHETFIEVEVEQEESIIAAIKEFQSISNSNTLGILLDNFSPDRAKNVIEKVKKDFDISNILFEVSGGVTFETLKDWNEVSVDIISVGGLTHSVKAVDLSLDLII
jgi:nicotinate-nucleotide pyrophosphorylase (carboxylating)